MEGPKNPIIKYLVSDDAHQIPQELHEKLVAIFREPDVDKYLAATALAVFSVMSRADPDQSLKALRSIILSSAALGYLYGSEGNKTSAEIATDVLKDLNIKEG